jgi:hypothetical protein
VTNAPEDFPVTMLPEAPRPEKRASRKVKLGDRHPVRDLDIGSDPFGHALLPGSLR